MPAQTHDNKITQREGTCWGQPASGGICSHVEVRDPPHFICCAQSNRLHIIEHDEMKSCFGGKKGLHFQICRVFALYFNPSLT